jgi:hypothetical protein
MPTKTEPQSYGSQSDWTSGETGQSVNDQKSTPRDEHAKRDEETNGGSVSPVQLADTEGAQVVRHGTDDAAAQRVTGVRTGAKREGFFKDRDYK